MKQLQILQSYNIPTTSYLKAIQMLNEDFLTDNEYKSRINELAGESVDINDASPKHTYLYFVENVIRNGENDWVADSIEKAKKFVVKYDWAMRKETPQQTDEQIVKTGKKGAKKIQAIALWNKRKEENMKRKEWIALLVQEIGLTPAGASTYFHNLKTGKYQ